MSYPLDDTIAAMASPPGGSARSIVRLSGPDVRQCLAHVFKPDGDVDLAAVAQPTVVAGSLRLETETTRLPCELFLWPTAKSFTGQPVAEIHTFGSPPLVEAVLETLAASGARLAERGEFTLRAFLAVRLDLTQAEAVLGAVDAADPGQLDAALSQLAGGLARPLGRLRDRLLDLLAHLEAGFDFADEDLPFVEPEELAAELAFAAGIVDDLARRMETRHSAADRPRVVLLGWPNVGKSSLFNALLGKHTALVSEEPGTTRDYLTAETEFAGAKCLLVDTAGVEEGIKDWGLGIGKRFQGTGDRGQGEALPDVDTYSIHDTASPSIRQRAQSATASQASSADVEVLCLDATRPLNAWERSRLAGDALRRVVVLTKMDIVDQGDWGSGIGDSKEGGIGNHQSLVPNPQSPLPASSVTGEGLDQLRARIGEALFAARPGDGEVVAATAVRCHDSLRRAGESLGRARRVLADGGGEELVAAELRAALAELAAVVGATYTDDLLDRIFSRFCVGK